MAENIDFAVSETVAIGHDALNVIVYRRTISTRGKKVGEWSDWLAMAYVYLSKAILCRVLREMGVDRPENDPVIAAMPSDLRRWRAAQDARQKAS